jgi:hypothetical protein
MLDNYFFGTKLFCSAEDILFSNISHCLLNKSKMDEEKQDILNTNEGAIVAAQNGDNAAQRFQPESEIKFDLQQKRIQVFLMFMCYVI